MSSSQLVARILVDEVLEYAREVKAIVEEVVSSALVEYLQDFVKIPLEGLVEEMAPVETVEVLVTSPSVLYIASTYEFPAVMLITQGVELVECDRDDEDEDDDYSNLESIDTSSEQSELSQSSEDWLASLEFVRDTEVGCARCSCCRRYSRLSAHLDVYGFHWHVLACCYLSEFFGSNLFVEFSNKRGLKEFDFAVQ